MNNIDKEVRKLPPFKRLCMTIGELPSSYVETMTYYESLLWFTKYLKDTVIPAINNNGEAVEELQAKYVELVEYVDNYFDNLDVQIEIDNKLDDMAESGQLVDIIAEYLEVNSVLGFDTKSALKGAENVVNGSITRTLGTSNYETGDGHYYKIRELEESDVIDDDNLLELSNFPTLVAEKIPDYDINEINSDINDIEARNNIIDDSAINVKLNGVVGDGVTDDTEAIQAIFDNISANDTIYFPKGTYLISEPLEIPVANFLSIVLDRNATITTDTAIDSLFYLTGGASYVTIDGGYFNANRKADYCIKTDNTEKYDITYKNMILRDPLVACIKERSDTSSMPSEHGYIYNCKIYCPNTKPTGFEIIAHDFTISRCEIYYITYGAKLYGTTTFTTTHIWSGFDNATPTTGILFDSASELVLTNMYFDGVNRCVDTNGKNAVISLTDSIFLFGTGQGTYNNPIIVKNNFLGRLVFDNNIIRSDGTYVSITDLTNINLENIQNTRNKISNVSVHYNSGTNYNFENISYGNNINVITNTSTCIFNNYASISNSKFYKIGYVVVPSNRVATFDLTFTLDDFSKYYQNVKVALYNNGESTTVLAKKSTYTYGSGNYAISIGVAENVTDNLGNNYNACPVYVKVISNQGSQYAMNVTNTIKNNNGILCLNQENFIKEYSSPSLLDTLDSNI